MKIKRKIMKKKKIKRKKIKRKDARNAIHIHYFYEWKVDIRVVGPW